MLLLPLPRISLPSPLHSFHPSPPNPPPPPQYPGEKEVTFPPFTCLEADGDPRVEHSQGGEVVVFPLKVSAAKRRWLRLF